MNPKIYNYIILTIGLTFFSVASIIASLGYKYYEKKERSFWFIFFISLFFGIISYFIKIPLLYYYGKEDTLSTYILSIVILTFLVMLHSKYILSEKIQLHTDIITILIVFLVVLNAYLSFL